MARMSAPHRLMDVGSAADYLGTSPRFVRRLIAERRIKFFKIGRHVRLDVDDLAAFVQRGVVEPLE